MCWSCTSNVRSLGVPVSLGIPAREAVEQERLEIRRVRGRPRDEARQVEVEALQGRGSAGAPQDRKLDDALIQRTGDGVQGDAWRILQTRDVSTLLCPDHGRLVGEQGHAERVGGVGQREEERLDGGHGRLGAARPPAAVQGQLIAGDRFPMADSDGDAMPASWSMALFACCSSLWWSAPPHAESLHKRVVELVRFAGHDAGTPRCGPFLGAVGLLPRVRARRAAITARSHAYLYVSMTGKRARIPSGSWSRMRRSQATKVPLHDRQSIYSPPGSIYL